MGEASTVEKDLMARTSWVEKRLERVECEQREQHDRDMELGHQVDDLHKVLFRNGFRADIKQLKKQQIAIMALLIALFSDTALQFLARFL